MAARPRDRRRMGWPRGLHEPRPGYYIWKHPDGRTLVIGRVPLAVARNEAMAANQHVQNERPGLVEKLTGAGNTISKLIELSDRKEPAKAVNTARSRRSIDNIIRKAIGEKLCGALSVADCAKLLNDIRDEGKLRTAQALRARLVALCRLGMEEGWMDSNPAAVTKGQRVETARQRLTLEQFQKAYAAAPDVAEWLQQAMLIGLLTGADRSTIAAMTRDCVGPEYLTFQRGKTGVRIAVPLRLRLDVVGMSVADAVAHKSGVVSRYLVHHAKPYGNAPVGSPVHPDSISRKFTAAMELAGFKDDNAPTFHEIRSLCKRLYDQQSNVDTKALLGHKTDRMAEMYADPRGVEAIKVRVS